MSKNYEVLIPMSGCMSVFIEADTEEEAMESALNVDFHIEVTSDKKNVELTELELHKHINTGNVCHAVHWDIEAYEVK